MTFELIWLGSGGWWKAGQTGIAGQAGPGLVLGPVPTHQPNQSLVIGGCQGGRDIYQGKNLCAGVKGSFKNDHQLPSLPPETKSLLIFFFPLLYLKYI